MIIIPKLSSKEEQILQIANSYNDHESQYNLLRELFPDTVYNLDFGDMSGPNVELTSIIKSLKKQGFIYQENDNSPLTITATGRGYLENNSILLALLDQAFIKLDLPEEQKSNLKNKVLKSFSESGQDFLAKLICEGLGRLFVR